MNDTVKIQVQDITGNWLTIHNNATNSGQSIMNAFKNAHAVYPNKRVRAIDQQGRLVDMQ